MVADRLQSGAVRAEGYRHRAKRFGAGRDVVGPVVLEALGEQEKEAVEEEVAERWAPVLDADD